MGKKPKPLLGPDGKPLDVAKYRPAPKAVAIDADYFTFTWKAVYDTMFGRAPKATAAEKRDQGSLDGAIRRDVKEATRTARGFKGHAELPAPPAELRDTYAVAHAEAVRKCDHKNSTCISYSRGERQCDDCGRYFIKKEMYW